MMTEHTPHLPWPTRTMAGRDVQCDVQRDEQGALTRAARRAGMLYLVLLTGAFDTLYIPRAFIVAGDAAATAQRIVAGERLFRIGILGDLVSNVAFLCLGLSLYTLLADVDRRRARLMVAFVAVGATLGVINLLTQIAPLVLLASADLRSTFTAPQVDALVMTSLRLRTHLEYVVMVFWGLWLYPFGRLVLASGYFPRLLGHLLIVGCVAYLALSVTSLGFPAYRLIVGRVALPFYAVGELAMIGWLLVKGATARPGALRPSYGA